MSRAPSQPSRLPEATMHEFAASIGLRPTVDGDVAVLRQMMVGSARRPSCAKLMVHARSKRKWAT